MMIDSRDVEGAPDHVIGIDLAHTAGQSVRSSSQGRASQLLWTQTLLGMQLKVNERMA